MPFSKPRSLANRLLLAAALVLPMFVGFSGYMLDMAFQRSLLAGEQEQLKTHIYLLLTAAELQAQSLQLPDALNEPRFSQPNSGLYAQVLDPQQHELWRSPSARLLLSLQSATYPVFQPGQSQFTTAHLQSQAYFVYQYDILWETEQGQKLPYRFRIFHSQQTFATELHAYRQQLGWLLGGLTLLLLTTQTLIMRWGLGPLKTLAANLRAVEQGQTQQLQGQYPEEIQPVTDNLNRVLNIERSQRERYRHTLADLAHSLKTPLAVLRNGLQTPQAQLLPLINEQISRMDQIIQHQLQRATAHSELQILQPTNLHSLITRLNLALQKVYAEKNIHLHLHAATDPHIHGAEADLLELLGNILDNAFKYGKQQVSVNLSRRANELTILIADDGPGIPKHLQTTILQRGARADTAQPGHGIGLAVAVDIISSYRGSLSIDTSEWGGAAFKIILPI